jgi:hypothetical protein
LLTAIYEDKGAGSIPSLATEKTLVFSAPVLDGADFEELNGPERFKLPTGGVALQGVKNGGSGTTREFDMTGVGKIKFTAVLIQNVSKNGTIDVYLDSKDGKKLGTVDFTKSPKIKVADGYDLVTGGVNFAGVQGKHKVVLVFNNDKAEQGDLFMFGGMSLDK